MPLTSICFPNMCMGILHRALQISLLLAWTFWISVISKSILTLSELTCIFCSLFFVSPSWPQYAQSMSLQTERVCRANRGWAVQDLGIVDCAALLTLVYDCCWAILFGFKSFTITCNNRLRDNSRGCFLHLSLLIVVMSLCVCFWGALCWTWADGI